jgi:cytochrome c
MMKKVVAFFTLISVLSACGSQEGANKKASAEPAAAEQVDISSLPEYKEGLALVAQSDCTTCHKVNEASTGPAYAEVAARYQNAADTTIQRVIQHVIKGGSGQWGQVPMTPHPTLSEEDVAKMMKYILLLKK